MTNRLNPIAPIGISLKGPVGYHLPADLVAAVLGPGAGLRRATEIADVRKFLATSRPPGR
jgi:hypothetical protein